MVKWVCQIVTPIRHRALVFDARLSAGNTANDTLVTGNTFRFCRLMCLCVKRRNIILNGKRRSLFDSALFRADNRTGQKTFSPFSLALILTFDFAALSERRSCPEDRSRRFVLLGALDAALRQRTYPVRTVMQMTADETSLVATVQGQLQDAMNFEGSSEEKQIRSFLATFGIDYDKLTKEQFVSLIEMLMLFKYLKSPINQRGKSRPQLPSW